MTKPTTTTQKPTGKGKLRSKSGAKYNGVALPEDATQRRRMRNKLSAQVHRKRKQDALNTAKEEVDGCDVVICNLKMQLDDTRTKVKSLQSIMDSIQLELGAETVQHIFQQVGVRTPPMADSGITTIQSVTSESEVHVSSSSSDDDSCSLGCIIKEELGSAI